MKPGDLVVINSVGLKRHDGHDGILAVVQKQVDDIILASDKIPFMWEIYCFKLGKKMIFFEDELVVVCSKEDLDKIE